MLPPDDEVDTRDFVERRPTGAVATVIPPGRWAVDPTRTSVTFVAKHLLVSKVTGTFTRVAGTITVTEDVAGSSASAMADAASLTTGDTARDEHLRSTDFFDVERWPHAHHHRGRTVPPGRPSPPRCRPDHPGRRPSGDVRGGRLTSTRWGAPP